MLGWLAAFILLLSGCQLGYVVKSSYSQLQLLSQREDIHKVIKNHPDEAIRKKLILSLRVREFCESKLKLKLNHNYLTYVQLDRPYVTYVVSAAQKFEFKPYQWWFPIIGHVPYKGFFNAKEAMQEAEELKQKNLDVYVRGVSAYSTLGWFDDPLLSSMMTDEIDLINTIIHENIHANIYISGQSELNENLATFFGDWGTEIFLSDADYGNPDDLLRFQKERRDEVLFRTFVMNESEKVKAALPSLNGSEPDRQKLFENIKTNFKAQLLPQLSSQAYSNFLNKTINNAYLYQFTLYSGQDEALRQFAKKWDNDFQKSLHAASLIKSKEDLIK